jgi:hypothetical protein
VFWAIPDSAVPAELKEKIKGVQAYDSIFATQSEVGDFGGVELKRKSDYNDCAVLCYSSGTVSTRKRYARNSSSSWISLPDWSRQRYITEIQRKAETMLILLLSGVMTTHENLNVVGQISRAASPESMKNGKGQSILGVLPMFRKSNSLT